MAPLVCRAKTRRFPEILSVLVGNYDTWKVAGVLERPGCGRDGVERKEREQKFLFFSVGVKGRGGEGRGE